MGMTREQVHDLMKNELRCIQKANSCDRDCAKCSLVKDDKELIEAYRYVIKALEIIKNGIPLDDVKAEISEEICLTDNPYTKETKYTIGHIKLLEILDNIGKAESEKRNDQRRKAKSHRCSKNISTSYGCNTRGI